MRASFRLRIRLITCVVLLVAGLLLTRLYFIQIVHGEQYSSEADRQYVRTGAELYDRGNIFLEDKEGRLVSGATLKSGFTIALNPANVEDPEAVYQALEPVLSIDRETFLARAGKHDDPYEEVAHRVLTEDAKAIEELGMPGVNIYRERWRYYPGDSLAAQTIGFVGFQGDDYAGRYGLERYYNDTLSREDNSLYVNFFAEVFANIRLFTSEKSNVGDLITTLEPSVQLALERTLEDIHNEWNSKQTAGIVIDPKTGSIYALGVYPAFSLNAFSDVEDSSIYVNPLVEGVFEMGSIIKPLTMAAGIDSGVVAPETTYNDQGSVTLDGYTISNFDGIGRGMVSMQEILSQSLNTGVVFVEQEMGHDTFREYMKKYKIGEETGIDLPGEVPGIVGNLDTPRDIEYATASFGQGIAMTPIQTVRALSVLANGGVLVTPHVGERIKYESGLSKNITYPDGDRVLDPETSEEITRMLVHVVDEALGGGDVELPNYSIAAKTGTAQIAHPEGGYYDDRYLHSFFGYFPAYNPQFLVFLMTIEPKGVRYASQTLTNPFMDMTQFLINYYEVPPDR
jgi:cell division protein FtsI (penicillin-binding protein 3)/stage V sporulation protein D (sporulation-specific penicillin-binding protein)